MELFIALFMFCLFYSIIQNAFFLFPIIYIGFCCFFILFVFIFYHGYCIIVWIYRK